MNVDAASSRWYRNLLLVVVGIFLIVLAAFFAHRKPQALTGPAADFQEMFRVKHEVEGTYEQAKAAFAEGKIDAETFVGVMRTEVLAPWREAEARFRKVDTDKLSEKGERLYQQLLELMKLREQAWGLIVDSIREGSDEGMAAATEKSAQADRIEEEIAAEYEAVRAGEPKKGTDGNGEPNRT